MKLPKIINQEEFERLFSAAKKKRDKAKKSKKRINQYMISMILGFEAGMRISEILGYKDHIPPLSKSQIEVASIRIISGKGGKDRIVPRPKRFNHKAMQELPLFIDRRPLQLFITKLGHEVLNKHITFHTLRHGFGSHLAGMGRPLHEIQMLMGHSRLDTTGIYLHANPKQAIEGARDVF
ncbi:MAG: tyrosine-type recombinase/integrase [Promethearchaeota archaeon]